MRRWFTIALAVSVALNLFFLGVAAARLWQHREWRPRGDAALQSVGAAGSRGQDGRRGGRRGRGDPLAWMTEAERAELRPKRQALVGIRRDAEQVLLGEPFDATKFRSSLDALRAQTTQIQLSVHERLIERAQGLSLEERLELAKASWGTPGERGRSKPHRDQK